MKTTTVRFPKDQLNLVNGLAALSGKPVHAYLAGLVEADAKAKKISIGTVKPAA